VNYTRMASEQNIACGIIISFQFQHYLGRVKTFPEWIMLGFFKPFAFAIATHL